MHNTWFLGNWVICTQCSHWKQTNQHFCTQQKSGASVRDILGWTDSSHASNWDPQHRWNRGAKQKVWRNMGRIYSPTTHCHWPSAHSQATCCHISIPTYNMDVNFTKVTSPLKTHLEPYSHQTKINKCGWNPWLSVHAGRIEWLNDYKQLLIYLSWFSEPLNVCRHLTVVIIAFVSTCNQNKRETLETRIHCEKLHNVSHIYIKKVAILFFFSHKVALSRTEEEIFNWGKKKNKTKQKKLRKSWIWLHDVLPNHSGLKPSSKEVGRKSGKSLCNV